MRIRRGCRLPRRKRFRYGPKPNRHPRSLRAASPRSRRKRPRSKRQGPLLAGRAPLPLESKQIRSGATLRRPGHSVLAPGSDRHHALIGRTPAADHGIRPVMGTADVPLRPSDPAQLCIDKLPKPAGVLPGGMWQTRHTAGTMAIALTEIAPRAELIKQPDVKRPGIRAGGMIAIPLPNIGSMGGAYGHAQEVLFPALSVDPNRFFFVRCAQPILRRGPVTHGMLGGDGIACSASSAGRRGWVERSETHPRVTA
jgi:hypothetical protein